MGDLDEGLAHGSGASPAGGERTVQYSLAFFSAEEEKRNGMETELSWSVGLHGHCYLDNH